MASWVALDLPYWAMHSALYRLIRMAIKMVREAVQIFYVVDFMSCITVAKRPCYGRLKIKRAILLFFTMYQLMQLVYYGGLLPATAMNAALAIIADGG